MSTEEITKTRAFHKSFPQYTETPLTKLEHMAAYLSLKELFIKDESYRFGLNAFKVLGGSYAMYIGKGSAYQHEVVDAVTQGFKDGILEQKPTLVNLQCDIDHPTQCMHNGIKMITQAGFNEINNLIFAITFGLGYGVSTLAADIKARFPLVLQYLYTDKVAAVCVISVIACLLLGERVKKTDKTEKEQE